MRLVFVYNVDASPVALLKDAVQGIRTGSTDCNLCDVTFGRVLKDRSWKRFVADLPVDVAFQMRSTFRREHPGFDDHEFPAAFVDRAGELEELISADAMNAVDDIDALRTLVSRTLASL